MDPQINHVRYNYNRDLIPILIYVQDIIVVHLQNLIDLLLKVFY
nr:MAG TPA: hypothetical protein [Caudoviricetes sp.]